MSPGTLQSVGAMCASVTDTPTISSRCQLATRREERPEEKGACGLCAVVVALGSSRSEVVGTAVMALIGLEERGRWPGKSARTDTRTVLAIPIPLNRMAADHAVHAPDLTALLVDHLTGDR